MSALERFAIAVLAESREELGDIDGGWLQDKAVELGVLVAVEVDGPCADQCRCEEYGDWPMNCYRYSPEVAAAITECAAAQMTKQATAGPDDQSEPPTPAPPAPLDPDSQLFRSLLKSGVSLTSKE